MAAEGLELEPELELELEVVPEVAPEVEPVVEPVVLVVPVEPAEVGALAVLVDPEEVVAVVDGAGATIKTVMTPIMMRMMIVKD